MKLEYPKEWFEKSASIEGAAEVGAGKPAVAASPLLVRLIQCGRRGCGHVLTEDERAWKPTRMGRRAICPECGGDSFYTLKPNGQAAVWSEREIYRAGIDPTLIEPAPRMGPKRKAALLAAKRRILAAIGAPPAAR